MILAVGNTKGGVGKTTLAVNLAVARALAGRDLLLVDGDEQGTALSFTELRAGRPGQAGYTAVALTGVALRSQVRQLAAKYGDIIIDVGGRDTGSLRAALTVAYTVLVPVQPRSFDVWALDQVAALVAEAREINEGLRAVAVLYGADAQGADNETASEMIGDIVGIEVLPQSIVRRKEVPKGAAEGRAEGQHTQRAQEAHDSVAALVSAV